jgi:hypothetical protein
MAPRKRTVRLTPTNDRNLLRVCAKLGLDQNGAFNAAIAKFAEAEGVAVKTSQSGGKLGSN